MHNRNHGTTPALLPPSPSIGDLKKITRTESKERLLARVLLSRDKKYPVIFTLVIGLSIATLFRHSLRSGTKCEGISEPEDLISPFVTQAEEDIKPKYSLSTNVTTYSYNPSSIEQYILTNKKSLGYETEGTDLADTCTLLLDQKSPIYESLQQYYLSLSQYNNLVQKFQPLQDLRLQFNSDEEKERACAATKLHTDGLPGIFQSGLVSSSSKVGLMEPLLPTMRSHKICRDFDANLLSMDYLVHDFYSMCRQLKRHSRLVFIDMGASLDFHEDINGEMPAIYITTIYSKFGFKFDHIYAYEVEQKHPAKVFEAVPDELQSSWHWINVGVDARKNAKMNPFTMMADSFTVDDFIVVKLDIDTPAVEMALVEQLREDPILLQLVDQFYFEHHVYQAELAGPWTGTMEGSVGSSLELMAELRKNGVAAHYWP